MVVAQVGKELIVLYVVGFESGPEEELVDNVDEDRERRCIGIGTKGWSEALSSDDDVYDINVGDDDEVVGSDVEEGGLSGMAGTSYEEGRLSNDRDDHDDIDPKHVYTPNVRSDEGDDNAETYPEPKTFATYTRDGSRRTVTARPKTSKKKGRNAQLPYSEPPAVKNLKSDQINPTLLCKKRHINKKYGMWTSEDAQKNFGKNGGITVVARVRGKAIHRS
ncbi:hypothetical protein CJ030_MR7G027938 [Morella rubra]|uniref:Uncharacterized protein n=1 Tax=Morella rubra TaxID=262757 RepID=A0A6A1V1Y6_9ROSI|nr:hypothetical protein CJ030_MR7G027938 [Morella rubra]